MAITNCSIPTNLQTFVNDGGSAIGADVAELIIVPDTGYTVRASSFSNNTGTQSWLSSITLTDTDTTLTGAAGYPNADIYYPYGTTANTVKITVTLNPLYTMPNADTTLTVDIDDVGEYGGGQANVVSIYLDDIHDVITNTTVTTTQGTGITATASTASSVTTTTHEGNVVGNLQTTLFTKTFAAASTYYYINPPVPTSFFGGLDTRYDLTHVDTLDSYGNVTQRVWTVKYTGDTNITSADNHNIVWSGDDGKIPTVAVAYVQGLQLFYFDVSGNSEEDHISQNGEERRITVTGSKSAQFSLTITKYGEIGATSVTDNTYNFSTNVFTAGATTSGTLTIPASGTYTTDIIFPAVTANDSYGFDIARVGDTVLNAAIPQGTPDIILYQYYADTTYTVVIDSPIHKSGGSGEQRYDTLVTQAVAVSQGENKTKSSSYHTITLVQVCKSGFTYPATAADEISTAFTTADIATASAITIEDKASFGFSRLTATRTNSTTMTYTFVMSINSVGAVDGNITVNVDGIIIPT